MINKNENEKNKKTEKEKEKELCQTRSAVAKTFIEMAKEKEIGDNEEYLEAFVGLVDIIEKEKHPLIQISGCNQQVQHFCSFLQGKKLNPENAWKKLVNFHEWYEENSMYIFPYERLKQELETGKVLLLMKDKHGGPVVLVNADIHLPGIFPRQNTVDLVAHLFCQIISVMTDDSSKATVVVDLKGFGLKNKDDGILKDIGAVVSKYFPNRVRHLLVINAGMIVNMLWKAITPFIEQKYLDLFHFLSYPKDLAKFIPANDLPIYYGGVMVTDSKKWLEESIRFFREKRPINLHTFCRSGQGENVEDAIIKKMHDQAETKAEFSDETAID